MDGAVHIFLAGMVLSRVNQKKQGCIAHSSGCTKYKVLVRKETGISGMGCGCHYAVCKLNFELGKGNKRKGRFWELYTLST